MKKFISGLVFIVTIMSCTNVINIPTEVPEYKPEDGVTLLESGKIGVRIVN